MELQKDKKNFTVLHKTYMSSEGSHQITSVTHIENNAYVEYADFDSMLEYLSSGDDKLKKKILKEIDRKYYRNFRLVEGERVKRCVDIVGVVKSLRHVGDYEIHKCIISNASGTGTRAFGYEKLIDSLRYASGKLKGYNNEVQCVNRYDRLEGDYKHNNIDNRDKEGELSQKEKAELFDEFIKLRDNRRKAKNDINLTDQYRVFFERFHITPKDLDVTINNMKNLHTTFKKGVYNQRSTDMEKEQWKTHLSTKYKVK